MQLSKIVRVAGVFYFLIFALAFLQTACSGSLRDSTDTIKTVNRIGVVKTQTGDDDSSNDGDKSNDDTNTAVSTALYGFGGMYSYSGTGFKNPATNAFGCLAGYSAVQVHGSEGEDADLYVCQKELNEGETGYFDFGGMYGTHSTGAYENPITGASSCPIGFTQYQVYGDSNWDFNLFYCVKIAETNSQWGFGFGGMFGEQRDSAVGFPHPQTHALSCPLTQTEFSILGSSDKDWPLSLCASTLSDDVQFEAIDPAPTVSFDLTEYDRGYFAFGGMYSVSRANPANNFPNPATLALSCPDGYIAHQVQGRDRVSGNSDYDADLYFCYKEDQGRFELAEYDFGGIYGYGTSYNEWKNPFTNAMSCPNGFSSYKVLDEYGLDWPMWFCYREQKRDQPTPYSFGGAYSSGDAGVLGSYANVGSLGSTCPADHSATQSHGADYSRLDIRLFICGNIIP